jgi:hypothetical protein
MHRGKTNSSGHFYVEDVFKRKKGDTPRNKRHNMVPFMYPLVMRPGSWLHHNEQHGFFPGGADAEFSTNPFTFYVFSKPEETQPEPYWSLSSDDVGYVYKTTEPLLLLNVPELEDFRKWLDFIVMTTEKERTLFESLPYNPREDKTDPHHVPESYAWDYLDLSIICRIFRVDGIVRSDEVILCSRTQSKMKLVSKHVQDGATPQAAVYEGSPLYYQLPPATVAAFQANIHIERVKNALRIVREKYKSSQE